MHCFLNDIHGLWNILWANWWGTYCTRPRGVSWTPVIVPCLTVEASRRHTGKALESTWEQPVPEWRSSAVDTWNKVLRGYEAPQSSGLGGPIRKGVHSFRGEFRVLKACPKWFARELLRRIKKHLLDYRVCSEQKNWWQKVETNGFFSPEECAILLIRLSFVVASSRANHSRTKVTAPTCCHLGLLSGWALVTGPCAFTGLISSLKSALERRHGLAPMAGSHEVDHNFSLVQDQGNKNNLTLTFVIFKHLCCYAVSWFYYLGWNVTVYPISKCKSSVAKQWARTRVLRTSCRL